MVDAIMAALEDELARSSESSGWKLDSLIERAGVGVGSFYEYFTGKDSLLGALAGTVTEKNSRRLLAEIDSTSSSSLEEVVEQAASVLVVSFLERPQIMRTVIETIERLGLMGAVVAQRDRFAADLAERAAVYLPEAPRDELVRSMQLILHATVGMLGAELTRGSTPDIGRSTREVTMLVLAFLRARHGPKPETASD